MTEICTITITIFDKSDHYHEEDAVKTIWPHMLPWFTRRHGWQKGTILLDDGGVQIQWEYRSELSPEQVEWLKQQGVQEAGE